MGLRDRDYMKPRRAVNRRDVRPVLIPLLWITVGFLLAFLFTLRYPEEARTLLSLLASFLP